ncbi:MAG TPA: type II secretion system protein GspJ [Serratia grimesii]|uniref:Type II secretion system protein J n=1 Tax=Serratia grimesii TaxID=82995 RepID=A0A9C7QWZ4_9GAMM|nr:type II secretion system minor pseudopilin GspJ [Serratia grimesii]HCK00064.1 type II secretion system protein GspJ [Serratia grimesii]
MNTYEPRGFTLLEMLIAIALLALIGLIGVQLLQGVLRSGEISQQHAGRLAEAQRAFGLLEQDIGQALKPPIAADHARQLNNSALALPGGNQQLRLLRRNWLNPGGYLPRSALEQVQWQMIDGVLQRRSFGFPAQATSQFDTLFPSVNNMRLRYWLNDRWLENWFAAYALPQAIEVTLEMPGYGALQRIFFITGEP